MQAYLSSTKKLFSYYKKLGDDAIAQMDDEQLFQPVNEEANSVAIIMQHLSGNMLSRWTGFLTTDGEKEWRDRDAEFELKSKNKTDLFSVWNNGWQCLFHALDSLSDADLDKIIYIRNEGHTVLEAINRQLAHYSYHVGQIVYVAKMIVGKHWTNLSIPKNNSEKYNNQKFSEDKKTTFFTDKI